MSLDPPFCSLSQLPGNPEVNNLQGHTLLPCFSLSTDLEAMEPQPWMETSEALIQKKPFLFMLIFLGYFVTVTENNTPSRPDSHAVGQLQLNLHPTGPPDSGNVCPAHCSCIHRCPGLMFIYFPILRKNQRGHPVMSPSFLFRAFSFPN